MNRRAFCNLLEFDGGGERAVQTNNKQGGQRAYAGSLAQVWAVKNHRSPYQTNLDYSISTGRNTVAVLAGR